MDAAAGVAKEIDDRGPPPGSGSLCPDATTGPSLSVTPDPGVVFASMPLTKLVGDVIVPAESNLQAIESNLDLRPLRPFEFSIAPFRVLSQASSAVTKRAKKPAATSMSPLTRKKLAPGSGKIRFTVSLASCSLAWPAISFQSRSLLVDRPKG